MIWLLTATKIAIINLLMLLLHINTIIHFVMFVVLSHAGV